jgi:acetyltransferase-like isoleucine patch superfamily enzyme
MSPIRIYFINFIFKFLPPTRLFRIKCNLLRWAGGEVSLTARIVSSVRIYTTGRVVIGDDTWLGHEVMMTGGDGLIEIGSKCDVGPRVVFASGTHEIDALSDRVAGLGYSMPIKVSDGVWIGVGAIILGGVTIGRSAVVAAGAVVNKDVPPFSLVAGVPARIVRNLSHKTDQ